MRLRNRTASLLLAALAGLLGCDWIPGSTLSWSQSVRTWEDLASGECLNLGVYEFALGATIGPFTGKSSISMRTDNKQDQENLPPFFDINWYKNVEVAPFYTEEFDLSKGKGGLRLDQPNFWTYVIGDKIRTEICAGGGGVIPTFTDISYSTTWKFSRSF